MKRDLSPLEAAYYRCGLDGFLTEQSKGRKVEIEMNMLKREAHALLPGHRNLTNDMARVAEKQVSTEQNATAIVSKIDAILTEVRAHQRNLTGGNRGMVFEMFAQQENIRKQEYDTIDRENSMGRTTEQAFRVTEQRMGEMHHDVRTMIDQGKQEKAETSASPNCPPERDRPMFDGR